MMRPASAYLSQSKSGKGGDRHGFDRPKTASGAVRQRTNSRGGGKNAASKFDDDALADEPKLLSSNQLTRLLQTPVRVRKRRPKTAPSNAVSRSRRGPFRPTTCHVDPLRTTLQPSSHGGAPYSPSERAARYISSAQRRQMTLSPFPQPTVALPSSKANDRIIDLERKIHTLSIQLLRSEKSSKKYKTLLDKQGLELVRLNGYKNSVVRFHGEEGAAMMEANNARRIAKEDQKYNADGAQKTQELKETGYDTIKNSGEQPPPIGGITSGGSHLLSEHSSVLEPAGNLGTVSPFIFEQPSSLVQPSLTLPMSHPLHPKNRAATAKRIRRLEEENKEMRMLNKQLEQDLDDATKRVRKLQSKVASEHKTNRSILDASLAVERYALEQAKRDATGASTYVRIGNDDHALKKGISAIARLNMQKTDEIAYLHAKLDRLNAQMKEQTITIRQFEAVQRAKEAELERARMAAKEAKKDALGDMGLEIQESTDLSQASSITINLDSDNDADESGENTKKKKSKSKGARSSDQKNRAHGALNKDMQLKLFEKLLYAEFATLPEEEHQKVYQVCMALRHVLSGSHIITQSMNMGHGIPMIVNKIKDALDCNRASVFILDEEKDQLYAEVERGLVIRIPKHAGIAGSSLKNDEVIVVNDTYADERFNKKADKKTGYTTNSLLTVPAHDATGKVVGVVQAVNKNHMKDFSLMDEVLLEMLSDAIGLMIGHSTTTEYHKSKYDSQKRLLNSLPRVWSTFLRDSPLDLLERLEKMICQLTNAARCVLFVKDNKKKQLWCSSTHHYIVDHVGWRRRKVDQQQKHSSNRKKRNKLVFPYSRASDSIVYKVASTGLPMECPSAYNSEYFNMNVDLDTKLPLICAPVISKARRGKEEIVGVIYLVMPSLPLQKQTRKLLENISQQIPTILKGAEALGTMNGLSLELQAKKLNEAASVIQSRMRGYIIRKKKRENRLKQPAGRQLRKSASREIYLPADCEQGEFN